MVPQEAVAYPTIAAVALAITIGIQRLSKHLLLVTKSRELQEMLRKKFISRVEFVLTTAFTDKPVSMKYRGIYNLTKRGDGFLQYVADCGKITLEEAVELWIRKYR